MPVKIVRNAIECLPMLIAPHRTDRIAKRDSHVARDRQSLCRYNRAIISNHH
ncbi:MAG TPA: hypothetical protein V6C71_00230 [Coleofasciculaceae cyanobacterium]